MNAPNDVLLTDLYQLTMLQTYFEHGMNETAVFEFFVRRMPERRAFLLAAGLEQVLEYLETLSFSDADLAFLAKSGRFSDDFVRHLADLKFTGDVDAVVEGTVVFENEPVVRVIAPLAQAQFIETRLINLMHLEMVVASKAVRSVLAAQGRTVVDFGLRRAHGFEAGLLSARAAYIAGFHGTATVLAGMRFGIPLYGTMAHSFIEAHDSEDEAFARFARSHPRNTTLLVDTYDTEDGVRKVAELAPSLAWEGVRIGGVRIDSGDLAAHAVAVRRILDNAGLSAIQIFASASLDEHSLADLLARGAPIDGFGVGTKMNTSADAPYLDCVYKLQEYAGHPKRKVSEEKATWPGRKQVYRRRAADGVMQGDTVTTLADVQPGEPLLAPAMRAGRRLAPAESLDVIRRRAAQQVASLPANLRSLDEASRYPVTIAPALHALAAETDAARRLKR
jgi:nicotinate phosphoribosyltransferase